MHHVIDCFHHYLHQEGNRISRAEFEANMHEKLLDPLFSQDLMPLLPAKVNKAYDIESAHDLLQQKFLRLLTGAAWKEKVKDMAKN
jgi:hypothetical protein